MDKKRILLISLVVVMIASSLTIVSAGWFDNFVEADTFKFEKPDGYSGSGGEGVIILTKDGVDSDMIKVSKSNKENYTAFIEKDFSALPDNVEVLKDVKEDNMRIVVEKNELMRTGFTTALVEKDGSYYSISMQHTYSTDAIDSDIQKVKDIYNSLEAI